MIGNKKFENYSSTILTIGIPVYNAEKTIKKSIDSLLQQTYNDFKLLISDNASTDSTQEICEDYAKKDPRIEYFKHKQNQGLLKNWNYILKNANTKYFMWAAADDFWDPDFIKKNILILESDKNIVGSISKVNFSDNFERKKSNNEKGSSNYDLVFNVSGSYENRIKSYLKFNQATAVYAIYRTDKLQKSMVSREYGAYDLQIILNVLEFGNLHVIDEFLMHRLPKGISSKSYIISSLNNKIDLTKIIFPYLPITTFCIKKLGIKFFLKNLLLFSRINANGCYLIISDILQILRHRFSK